MENYYLFFYLKYFIDPGWRGIVFRLARLRRFHLTAVALLIALLSHNDLIDVINQKYQKLVSVLK